MACQRFFSYLRCFFLDLADLSSLKTRFDHAVDGSPAKAEGVFHIRPIRAKRRKLKRAESDLSLGECSREEKDWTELLNFLS